MKHFGDITKINGADVPIVDIICGGSPCQDFSIANCERTGMDGERSSLIMEQIRITKEMRIHDAADGRAIEFVRPRFLVWENVKGVFSANERTAFQKILTEIIRIIEPNAPDVPLPHGGGKWTKSGCLYDEMGKWSVAWRLHNGQFWGTPQRRERIALVADFGGMCAPEILFERKGLRWNSEPSETPRKDSAEDFGRRTSISFVERAGCAGGGKGILIQNEKTGTLSTMQNQNVLAVDVYNHRVCGDIANTVTANAGGANTAGAKVLAPWIAGTEQ